MIKSENTIFNYEKCANGFKVTGDLVHVSNVAYTPKKEERYDARERRLCEELVEIECDGHTFYVNGNELITAVDIALKASYQARVNPYTYSYANRGDRNDF